MRLELKSDISIVILIFWFAIFTGGLTIDSHAQDNIVTFNIEIDKGKFSKKAEITVRIFNQEAMQAAEEIASCTVSYDPQTKREERRCPPGVVYKVVEPEVFTFAWDQIDGQTQVQSRRIGALEKYRVSISGRASDDCNSVQASAVGVASGPTVTLRGLSWSQTLLACPSMIDSGRTQTAPSPGTIWPYPDEHISDVPSVGPNARQGKQRPGSTGIVETINTFDRHQK